MKRILKLSVCLLAIASPAFAEDLDYLKNQKVEVHFTIKNETLRKETTERVKVAVGNKLSSTRATSLNGKTVVQVAPVKDPQAFVDRLKELGKVTKIEGTNIYLSVKTTTGDTKPGTTTKTPAPAANLPAANASQVAGALAALGQADYFARKKAAEYLSKVAPIDDRRDGVIKVLKNTIGDKEIFIRKAAVQAYGNWMNEDQADGLYPALNDADFTIRKAAMAVLAHFPSDKNAAEIGKRMADAGDRLEAGKALRAMGSGGEKGVQDLLKNSDWAVRLEGCKVLGQIGTSTSLKSLEARFADDNGLVRNAASAAVIAVKGREQK